MVRNRPVRVWNVKPGCARCRPHAALVVRSSFSLSWVVDEQLEFVKQIASRLASAEINYRMTGSMAMAVYATPRMTRDIDVVIESRPEHVDTIVRLFETDCYVSRDAVREATETQGMFNVIHNEWIIKADFIVRKDSPYRLVEFGRRREIDVQGTPVAVVAPEDLILSKLDWARESGSELQRRDVQNIIAAVGDLDWDYLQQWAGQLQLGETLEQVRQG